MTTYWGTDMDPIDKCKASIRAAIEELERETGRPVLTAQLVALTRGASATYVEDPWAVVKTISVGLRVSGSLKVLPWMED